ncbi:hypothetical protein [Tahibacter amnicola]|uniref:Uncharacterized protein n=1 Tax=Tahibacter amnicola TaxID=2976241 RepID=A0ABY6BH25_9GAMM|nr:hypothetical protein [Tahibacter amnicola]UXI68375.1 hypothetical protein N4264_01605 [Tahibacter amnicola]
MSDLLTRRRLAALAVVGVSAVAAAGPAVAFDNILTMKKSELISGEISVVADEIRSQGEDCNRAAPNTIGGAVKGAMTLHVKIAMKGPDVEPLFQADCVASLRQLWDISGAIGALGSLTWAAVRQAIMQAIQSYVQGKVCQAVNQVAGMINNAVDDVNNELQNLGAEFDYLNGMSTGLARQNLFDYSSMTSEVAADQPIRYTVKTNPFVADAIKFDNAAPPVQWVIPPPPVPPVVNGKLVHPAQPAQGAPAQQAPAKPKDDGLMGRMSRIFEQ